MDTHFFFFFLHLSYKNRYGNYKNSDWQFKICVANANNSVFWDSQSFWHFIEHLKPHRTPLQHPSSWLLPIVATTIVVGLVATPSSWPNLDSAQGQDKADPKPTRSRPTAETELHAGRGRDVEEEERKRRRRACLLSAWWNYTKNMSIQDDSISANGWNPFWHVAMVKPAWSQWDNYLLSYRVMSHAHKCLE